jgi:hypothetical protein
VFEPGSGRVGFVVDKLALGGGQVFSEYLISPANLHSTVTTIYHLGLVR